MDQQLFGQANYQAIPKERSTQFKIQMKEDQQIDFHQDKNISPWASLQFRQTFHPARFYQTMQQSYQKSNFRNGGSFKANNKYYFQKNKLPSGDNKVQVEESRRTVKLMKMNVSLDQDVLYSPLKKYGLNIENDQKNKNNKQSQSRSIRKQQPIRMKIFKKLLEKNNRFDEGKQGKKQSLLEGHLSFSYQPFSQKQFANNYPVLPKRVLKIREREKQVQNMQEFQRSYLPKVTIMRLTSSLYCKGQPKYKFENSQKQKYKKWKHADKYGINQEAFLLSDLSKDQ